MTDDAIQEYHRIMEEFKRLASELVRDITVHQEEDIYRFSFDASELFAAFHEQDYVPFVPHLILEEFSVDMVNSKTREIKVQGLVSFSVTCYHKPKEENTNGQ